MILDTVAISALLNGDPGLQRLLAKAGQVHLPVIVLGEYRYGLRQSRHRLRLETALNAIQADARVLAIDAETVPHYADVRETLRSGGNPIPYHDVWIAALARQHGLAIVSRDRHFDHIQGVKRNGW